jgi:hypothetical protein
LRHGDNTLRILHYQIAEVARQRLAESWLIAAINLNRLAVGASIAFDAGASSIDNPP